MCVVFLDSVQTFLLKGPLYIKNMHGVCRRQGISIKGLKANYCSLDHMLSAEWGNKLFIGLVSKAILIIILLNESSNVLTVVDLTIFYHH